MCLLNAAAFLLLMNSQRSSRGGGHYYPPSPPRPTPSEIRAELAREVLSASNTMTALRQNMESAVAAVQKKLESDPLYTATRKFLASTDQGIYLGKAFTAYSDGSGEVSQLILSADGIRVAYGQTRGWMGSRLMRNEGQLLSPTTEDFLASGFDDASLERDITRAIRKAVKSVPGKISRSSRTAPILD